MSEIKGGIDMKARVKATDRIIEVMCVMNTEGVSAYEDISGVSTTPIQYTPDELEFIDFPEMPIAPYTPDYWTRLEHQYAGIAMQGLCANPNVIQSYKGNFQYNKDIIAIHAKAIAHSLIEKIKEEQK